MFGSLKLETQKISRRLFKMWCVPKYHHKIAYCIGRLFFVPPLCATRKLSHMRKGQPQITPVAFWSFEMFHEVPAFFFKAEFHLRMTEGRLWYGPEAPKGVSHSVNQGMRSVDSVHSLQESVLISISFMFPKLSVPYLLIHLHNDLSI